MSGTFSYNTVQLYPPLLKVHYAFKTLSYIVCMLLIKLVVNRFIKYDSSILEGKKSVSPIPNPPKVLLWVCQMLN